MLDIVIEWYTFIRVCTNKAKMFNGTLLFQNKVHPRERDPKDLKFRGRIRIKLKNDDGTPLMEQFPTSK